MNSDVQVRRVDPSDAVAISEIYRWHVENGTATFETQAPTAGEWATKIETTASRGWPFLVIADENGVAGYAYATQFRDRPAYRYTCENSIYIEQSKRSKGYGKSLLTPLLAHAEVAGFKQMIAVVGGGEATSVALHRALGFTDAGCMRNVGYKFGQWLDTVYMQRALGRSNSTCDP
jgi:L-amino acid N-acyltransferase YncA